MNQPDGMVITSRQNSQIKDLKQARRRKGPWGKALLIEGRRLAEEALAARLPVARLFVDMDRWAKDSELRAITGRIQEAMDEAGRPEASATSATIFLPEALFQSIQATVQSQGLLLVCEAPGPSSFMERQEPGIQTLLYLEEVQDPGNLGTVLRSALAFGVGGILLGPGSCRLFHEKVLRSAMGAAFRLPFREEVDLGTLRMIQERQGARLVVADLAGEDCRDYFPATRDLPLILAIGNEGRGLSDEIRSLAQDKVTIPMAQDTESLNAGVATSLLVYERMRALSL